jgi:hypothetical protein
MTPRLMSSPIFHPRLRKPHYRIPFFIKPQFLIRL